MIEHCEAVIKSIELQLVRVETCGCAEGYSRDGKNKINSYKIDTFVKKIYEAVFRSDRDTKYTNRRRQSLPKSCYSNLHDISKIIYMSYFEHKQLQSW